MAENYSTKTPTRMSLNQDQKRMSTLMLGHSNDILNTLRLYVELEQFQAQLLIQEQDLFKLDERMKKLENSIPVIPKSSEDAKRQHKKYRRLANDINRVHSCPYQNCGKSYGSEISLNLHIRIKHNGGSKIDRENLAKDIMTARLRGDQAPKSEIQLPPGFLEEFCQTYNNFLVSEMRKAEKIEHQQERVPQD